MPVSKKKITSPKDGKKAVQKTVANKDENKVRVVGAKKPLFAKEKRFHSYLYKILKQVHPDLGISSESTNTINSAFLRLYTEVANEAGSVSRKTNSQTLSALDVQTAAKIILPQELANHAINEGAQAIVKYQASRKN